jgi:serine/threonine protein kinase
MCSFVSVLRLSRPSVLARDRALWFTSNLGEAESYQQYEVLKREDGSLWELGRGGMGVTYKAYDTKLRRVVALKVINKVYLSSDIAQQRFLREARAAAALQHQNVASIFNLGTNLGEYFYVMEFIDGETLDAYVRRKGPLELTEALNISLQASRALQAAAQQQLIHRDLKPSNLMLVDRQGERIVKVIDFGLAKSTNRAAEDSGTISAGTSGGIVGTPHFASPEQLAEGDVDIRTDIYSLGATLYFLLTGKPPFFGSSGQIIGQHLYKPLPIGPLAHLPSCAVDLIKRMMAKDRDERPQTPRDLQDEIFACLEQLCQSVDAIGPPAIGITSHPVKALAVGDIVAENYKLIEELGETAEGTRFLAEDMRRGRRVTLLALSQEFLSHTARLAALKQVVEQLRHATHPSLRNVYSFEAITNCSFLVEEYAVGPTLLELLRTRSVLNPPEVVRVLALLAPPADYAHHWKLPYVDFTLLGIQLIGEAPAGSTLRADLLRLPLTAWEHFEPKVSPIDFSLLAPEVGTWTGPATLIRKDLKGGERGSYVRLLSLLAYELFGGPRQKVETAGLYTPIAALTTEGNAVLRRGLFDELSSSVDLARQLAAAVASSNPPASSVSDVKPITAARLPQAVSLESKASTKTSHKSALPPLRLILGIAAAATIGIAGYFIFLWLRPAAQVERAPPSSQALRTSEAKLSSPGQSIVSSAATPASVPPLSSSPIPNSTVAVSRPGVPQPAVDNNEGAASPAVRLLTGHSGPVRAVAVTPDGARAVSASDDQTLRCWDLQTGQTTQVLRGHTGAVTGVAVTPDGYHAVSASDDKTLRIWDLQTGQSRVLTGHTDDVDSVAMLPGGRRFISGSHDGELRIWDVETGQTVGVLGPHTHAMVFDSLAATPDGRRAITGLTDGTLRVWNLGTGQAVSVLTGHTALVDSVALTPDGHRAISGSWDLTLRVWDLKTYQALRTLKGHTGAITDVAVIPTGSRAISASYDQTLRVWDLETGQTVLIFTENTSKFRSVAVTPDGRYAISGSIDGALRIWDLGAAGRPE